MLVTGTLNCEYMEWDSQQLNIGCGLIDATSNFRGIEINKLSEKIVYLLKKNTDMDFITIKAGSHLIETVDKLVKFGSDLIDTELVFVFKANTLSKECPEEYEFTFCSKTDFKPFISLADQMVNSRFFLDQHISETTAISLWSESIKNHCSGLADELLVCCCDMQPCGLVTLRFRENNSLYIHIVGVLEDYRGQSIAPMMLNRITDRYSKDYTIYIETSSVNLAAQKAYQKSGFVYDSLRYILHYWRVNQATGG